MKKVSLCLAALALTVVFSCKNANKKDAAKTATDSTATTETSAPKTEQITLSKVTDFPAYKDVTLTLEEPSTTTLQPGEINFNFDVTNLKLGEQTPGADKIGLANSGKGQHIHFILDGQPYMAFYEDDFAQKLSEGTHLLVAFPARSYHMSIKNKDAVIAKKLTVGQADNQFKDVDLTQPTLVYSRPKGTYKGADAQKVLLDFYLLNTDLAADGNKVRVTIDGQEFTLDDWAPYAIQGLSAGDHSITLELIDNEGNLLPGSLNKVERTITIEK